MPYFFLFNLTLISLIFCADATCCTDNDGGTLVLVVVVHAAALCFLGYGEQSELPTTSLKATNWDLTDLCFTAVE